MPSCRTQRVTHSPRSHHSSARASLRHAGCSQAVFVPPGLRDGGMHPVNRPSQQCVNSPFQRFHGCAGLRSREYRASSFACYGGQAHAPTPPLHIRNPRLPSRYVCSGLRYCKHGGYARRSPQKSDNEYYVEVGPGWGTSPNEHGFNRCSSRSWSGRQHYVIWDHYQTFGGKCMPTATLAGNHAKGISSVIPGRLPPTPEG